MERIDPADLAHHSSLVARLRPWTLDEETVAKQMRESGKTYAQISDVLDRSVASIQACLLRLDGRKPRRQATERRCMCCRNTFSSEGPHNRLCGTCRTKSISPYALF